MALVAAKLPNSPALIFCRFTLAVSLKDAVAVAVAAAEEELRLVVLPLLLYSASSCANLRRGAIVDSCSSCRLQASLSLKLCTELLEVFMLRSMGPSWAAAAPAEAVAVRAAPVSPPIEHTETGESDCILAAKLRGLPLLLLLE